MTPEREFQKLAKTMKIGAYVVLPKHYSIKTMQCWIEKAQKENPEKSFAFHIVTDMDDLGIKHTLPRILRIE